LPDADIFYHGFPSNETVFVSIFFIVYFESLPLNGEIPDKRICNKTPVDHISHFSE